MPESDKDQECRRAAILQNPSPQMVAGETCGGEHGRPSKQEPTQNLIGNQNCSQISNRACITYLPSTDRAECPERLLMSVARFRHMSITMYTRGTLEL